jgi:hypothetical protein
VILMREHIVLSMAQRLLVEHRMRRAGDLRDAAVGTRELHRVRCQRAVLLQGFEWSNINSNTLNRLNCCSAAPNEVSKFNIRFE